MEKKIQKAEWGITDIQITTLNIFTIKHLHAITAHAGFRLIVHTEDEQILEGKGFLPFKN